MTQNTLTADIIAKEAVMILDNNLVMAKKVYRGYEEEFSKKINGYTVGETISVRRPTDFTVREGSIMNTQEVKEGKFPLTVNRVRGIDFEFTSQELTLKIGELSERVIKPAMVQLANKIDRELHELAYDIPSWVGTPGQKIDSYTDFALGPERMDEYGNPADGRCAVLSPSDHWGLLGSQTSLYIQDAAKGAYRKGSLGEIGGIDTYMAQNVPTLTTGTRTGSILIDLSITSATTTYESVKDTNEQTIHIDALGGATQTVKRGEVFTIAGVWAVNPVTKERLPFLKQFVVKADATASASETDLVISPAMIWDGAFKNIDSDVADLNNQAVTFMGAASTNYRQNIGFCKNAFALVTVPMVSPPGAVDVTRQNYKGTNVRLIPVYDGTNDISKWRMDVLFGIKTVDERLAHRMSGSS